MPVEILNKPKLTKTDLRKIKLQKGDHSDRSNGLCVLEAVSWFAGEKHSDHPECVSPVIGAFLRTWNDDLDDVGRQKLKPYITKVVGTNTGKEDDEIRAWLVTDWMVRTHMTAWLELAGMTEQASAVRALAPITSPDAWKAGRETINGAKKDAAAAWAAAGAAAGDAAAAAAGAAAWAAAWAAAGAAAWDAAGAAAWAAAWAAAGAAAWDAAAAAAWAAAGAALRPTVKSLQASAFELLDELIAVGQ